MPEHSKDELMARISELEMQVGSKDAGQPGVPSRREGRRKRLRAGPLS